MDEITKIRHSLKHACTLQQDQCTKFFKTNKGDYAENDVFIGVTVPNLRKIAKEFEAKLNLSGIQELLSSKINEERFLALVFLVNIFNKESEEQEKIYHFYLENIRHINNWNLVDCSAPQIIGAYLHGTNKAPLMKLSHSKNMWERRISIVSTWFFIKNNHLDTTFKIAENLLNDSHDLIHKATGWMLREAGKRNEPALIKFLNDHAKFMPRTMLRYAIERFSEEKRKRYLLIKKYQCI